MTPERNRRDLAGPLGARLLRSRWVLQGTVELATATHLGSGEIGERADLELLRDAAGDLLLAGTTLAGALRGHLADRLAGYGHPAPHDVAMLFGGERGDPEGSQSAAMTFDAPARPCESAFEIRDSVAIEPAAGIAAEGAKWDVELVPPGTTFDVRVDLLVPAAADDGKERKLLALLAAALDGLGPGGIALGARRSRGLGELTSTRWRARRFDLATADGWDAWLATYPQRPLGAAADGSQEEQPPGEALAGAWESARELPELPDRRERVLVDAVVDLPAGLLVGAPGSEAGDPDRVQLSSGNGSVLPGSSLAGASRTRATRIARWVHGDVGERRVTAIFGPRAPRGGPPDLTSSRLRIAERLVRRAPSANVPPPDLRTVSRIRIDRHTQGVLHGGLFDEGIVEAGDACVHMRMELRNPDPGEAGLLALVLKDLLDGSLPVGGTVGIGRGELRGQGTFRVLSERGDAWRKLGVPVDEPFALDPATPSAALDALIAAFATADPSVEERTT